MKTTILLAFLTCGCFVSSYSQINHNDKRDTTWNDVPSFKYDIKPNLGNKNLITPHGSWNDMTFQKFGLTGDDQISKWDDRMPCYKPVGEFAIKIVKPDSTTHFTMLNKKF
jgi:hypothetical protein